MQNRNRAPALWLTACMLWRVDCWPFVELVGPLTAGTRDGKGLGFVLKTVNNNIWIKPTVTWPSSPMSRVRSGT